MAIIQKALSDLRNLQNEEIDLVGGAFSIEATQQLTSSVVGSYCNADGCHSIVAPDDSREDIGTD